MPFSFGNRQYGRDEQIYDNRIRRRRGGRGARGLRGGAGAGAHGRADAAALAQPGQHRLYGVQPLRRRDGEGASRARDRRAGRRDGPQRGQNGDPDADAQRGKRRRRAEPALAGGQARLPRADEAHAGKHGAPDHPPERGGRSADRGRAGVRRAHHLRGGDRRAKAVSAGDGRVPQRRRHRGGIPPKLRPQRLCARDRADQKPDRPRLYGAAVQDGHPRARGRAHHRLLQVRDAGGGPDGLSLLLPLRRGAADSRPPAT